MKFIYFFREYFDVLWINQLNKIPKAFGVIVSIRKIKVLALCFRIV